MSSLLDTHIQNKDAGNFFYFSHILLTRQQNEVLNPFLLKILPTSHS